ncbi:hypothetical protein GF351_06510 [Candidatus Woesearchaeota archaeon]|nr:hypothetical protein [Candidatus Woesearchaeota archaeon]
MVHKFFKSKIFISITIAISVILIWFIFSLTNNSIVDKQTFPQLTREFSGKASCINTDTGWSCEFEINRSEMENLRMNEIPIVESYKDKCQEMGGVWKCYGYCMPEYAHYCDFKYQDGGNLCISSLQCGDKCTGSFGVGKCSEYPLRFCNWYNEIFFGIPIPHHVFCD